MIYFLRTARIRSDLLKKAEYRSIMLRSLVAFAVSAASFLLIPVSDFNGTVLQKILAYIVGILFWGGLIAGIVMSYVLGKIRRKAKYKKYDLPGFLCFFKNRKARFFDSVMIAASVVLIIINFMGAGTSWICMIFLSAGVFSMYMHSVFNGNNYSFAVCKEVNK